jgi:predicted 3-demethylubiquinone-9 3-methyltransferase (glyoxalase superfamily)
MDQTIIPNLWFAGNAKEAAEFYVSIFPNSGIFHTAYYPASAEDGLADFQLSLAGQVLTVEFQLGGHILTAINAGPEFAFNPSCSFMVNFDPAGDAKAQEHLDALWDKLIEGGQALMPLMEYPFSKRYGWVQDRYGLSWQLILTNPQGEPRPFLIPSLMFGRENVNRAEKAINFYTSVFKDARLGNMARYPEDTGPAKAGSLMFGEFMLAGQWFTAMDSGVLQEFTFNEAFSLEVLCRDQAEIDYYWARLSQVPEAEQCGWCKDAFGVSWQIVPENMRELMEKPHAFAHLMEMKKLVIADF